MNREANITVKVLADTNIKVMAHIQTAIGYVPLLFLYLYGRVSGYQYVSILETCCVPSDNWRTTILKPVWGSAERIPCRL